MESDFSEIKSQLEKIEVDREKLAGRKSITLPPALHKHDANDSQQVTSPFKIRLLSENQDMENLESIPDNHMYHKLSHASFIKSIDEGTDLFRESHLTTSEYPIDQFMENLNQEIKIPTTSNVFSILHLANYGEGNFLISGHKDGKINVWEVDTLTLYKFYSEHTSIVDDLKAIRHSLFLSCSKDRSIKVWDLHGNTSLKTFYNDAWTYCITLLDKFRENFFASGDDNSNIKIWPLEGIEAKDIGISLQETPQIQESNNFNQKIEDQDNRPLSPPLEKDKIFSTPFSTIVTGHKNGIGRILFLTDYSPPHFLLSSSLGEIKLFDLNTSKCIRTYLEHTDWINGLIYLKEKLFCTASGDGSIKVWNLENSSSIKTFNIHTSNVASLIYLRDIVQDEFLMTASLGSTSKILDMNDGKVKAVFIRDEPIFKMVMIKRKVSEKGETEETLDDLKVAGCYWNSPNIKIWGKRIKL
jgi:WD40 repeat protein